MIILIIPADPGIVFTSLTHKNRIMEWDWNKFYNKAYDWLISYGPRVIAAVILFLVGLWLIRLINKSLRKGFERRKFNPSLRYFILNLVAISMQVLLVFFAL